VLASDDFSSVSASGWGTADAGGAWQLRYGPVAGDATAAGSSDGTAGALAVTSTSGLKFAVASVGAAGTADADVVVTARASRTTGAYIQVLTRVVDAKNFYAAQISLNSNNFMIRKNWNNVWSNVSAAVTPATPFAANTDYVVRFRVQGTSLMAKWWVAGQPEPAAWTVQGTDAQFAAGQVGVAGAVSTSSTTVTYSFDNFSAVEP
jgi:hypothetical protein